MKYIAFIILVTNTYYAGAYACQGAFKGVGTIEMKKDNSICLEMKPEGQPSVRKCFDTQHEKYQDILLKTKDIKPGEIRAIENDNC